MDQVEEFEDEEYQPAAPGKMKRGTKMRALGADKSKRFKTGDKVPAMCAAAGSRSWLLVEGT